MHADVARKALQQVHEGSLSQGRVGVTSRVCRVGHPVHMGYLEAGVFFSGFRFCTGGVSMFFLQFSDPDRRFRCIAWKRVEVIKCALCSERHHGWRVEALVHAC